MTRKVKKTAGTKVVADLEKCFQELISEKLLILLRDRPLLKLSNVSSNVQGFALLAGQITGISLKAMNSSKKSLSNHWTRPSQNNQARKRRININFLVRLVLGQTQVSPYFTQWKPSLSLGQTQFVPGTNLVCPWDKLGCRRAAQKVYVLTVGGVLRGNTIRGNRPERF